ncbi:cation diffusion facilitator family transporter [soil metagenome]
MGSVLNMGFVAIEATVGFVSGSTALLADAGHNLGDVAALLAAWGAATLAKRGRSERFTWGLRSASILAPLFNAVVLLVVTGAIAAEAGRRLLHPVAAPGLTVAAVALAGVFVNGGTAFLFAGGRKDDVNRRAVFLHMASDAVVSAGVAGAGVLMWFTGWLWLDPLASLAVSALIIVASLDLFRDTAVMALAAVPPGVDPVAVRAWLEGRPGVERVHDLHIWPVGSTDTALSCHLVMPQGAPGDAFLGETTRELNARFSIGHASLQVETDAACACPFEEAA